MDVISGAIFALAFMSGNAYVGATLDEQPRACDSRPDVVVSKGGYNVAITACEYEADTSAYTVAK